MTNELMLVRDPVRVSVRDRVLQMRTHGMFDGLDDDGILLLAEHGRTAIYADGEVVTVEGQPSRAVYMVTRGQLVIWRNGQEFSVRNVGDGYGGLPLLAHERSTLAIARGETHLLEVPGAAFEAALVENFSLLRNVLRSMGSAVLTSVGHLPFDPGVSRAIQDGVYHAEPRSLVERLIQLRQSPYGHLNLEALVDLARRTTEARYPAGTLLWSAGDISTHSLHIEAGRVRCTAPEGTSVIVGAGYSIGLLEVWGNHRRVYEARTETPMIAARIEFENFLSLLEAHPEVGLQLLRGFAKALLLNPVRE